MSGYIIVITIIWGLASTFWLAMSNQELKSYKRKESIYYINRVIQFENHVKYSLFFVYLTPVAFIAFPLLPVIILVLIVRDARNTIKESNEGTINKPSGRRV